MSLDARMDGLHVDIGRVYSVAGTWREDCTLAGSETLPAGMPELAERRPSRSLRRPRGTGRGAPASDDDENARPLLAAVDSRGRLPGLGSLRDSRTGGTSSRFARDRRPRLILNSSPPTRVLRRSSPVRGAVDLAARTRGRSRTNYGVQTVRVDAGGAPHRGASAPKGL